MHARDLVELATLVSLHGPPLVRTTAPLSKTPMQRYWSASKCRLDRWGRTLKQLASWQGPSSKLGQHSKDNFLQSVVEEVLTGEILSRVWAAVLSARQRRHTTEDGFLIARSILLGNQEARHRALGLLLHGPGVATQQAVELNRLRMQAERWTDILVGHLAAYDDVSELAAEPRWAQDFACDLKRRGDLAWSLIWTSLRACISTELVLPSPNPDLNAEIAGSVVACFPPELFDSTGLLRTGWVARLWMTTSETQGLIDELFGCENDDRSRSDPTAGLHPTPFLRRDLGLR
jgi:hypothetical protein